MHAQHRGTVIEVTLTREVAPGQYRTELVSAKRMPTGLFCSTSALAAYLAEEQRRLKQCLYRKPTTGS
jgi:hypothetical protein